MSNQNNSNISTINNNSYHDNNNQIKDTDTAQIMEVLELTKAIKNLNVEEVNSLFKKRTYWINTLNKKISQSIFIYNNDQSKEIKDIILILLSKSADVDVLIERPLNKKEKISLLMIACQKIDLQFIKEILRFRPNVNYCDMNGKNSLMNLIINYNGKEDNPLFIEDILLIIQNKLNINHEDNNGNTALSISVQRGFYNITNALLRNKANIDHQVKGSFKNTALHFAVTMGNIKMIKLLLTFKPNLLIANSYGRNIIDEASNLASSEIYKILAEEHLKRSETSKEDIIIAQNMNSINTISNQKVNSNIINSILSLNSSGNSNINKNNFDSSIKKQFSKISDIFNINLTNQEHHISEKDIKYAKIKLLSENYKNNINDYLNIKITNENLLLKLQSDISYLSDENSVLKIENIILQNELKMKEHLLDYKEEEIKIFTGNNNFMTSQGSQSFSGLNNIQKHLLGLNNLSKNECLEKKFQSTMYKDDYVMKSLHRDLIDFQEFNKDQIKRIKPIQEELLCYIKEAVSETLCDFEVKLYGSHATGLCLSWSDLDIVLIHKKGIGHITYTPCLKSLYIKISEKPWKKKIRYLESAVIPIIKIIASEKYNNMLIDISVQDSKHYGLKCVDLVRNYMNEYEALEPLLYSLKNLLKNANLNDPYTGGLSSYGLILMVVSFLQNHLICGKSIKINPDNSFSNLGRLFLEFCWYYGMIFDHTKYVINPSPINGNMVFAEKETISYLNVSFNNI